MSSPSHSSENQKSITARRLGIEVHQLFVVVLALIFLSAGTISAVKLIKAQYVANTKNALQTILEGANAAIRIWARDHIGVAQSVAREEYVITLSEALQKAGLEKRALLSAKAQEEIRERFKQQLQYGFYKGFFIIGPSNINLASSRDANVGDVNLLINQPDVLEKLWQGQASVSRVLSSDIALTPGSSHIQETMFVGAPIYDASGKVIAILTLRIDPLETLFPLLMQGRIGETGETYAFDNHGVMLTPARFEQDLIKAGIIEPGENSMLNVQIRDPGVDITKGVKSKFPIEQQPLTLMAKSAIRGEKGTNLEGYRDYRGVPVIGAWRWVEELGVGITTEQDVEEAYTLFRFIERLIYAGAVVVATIIFILTYVLGKGRRQVREAKNELQAIVESTIDGIVVINRKGYIKSVNPAVEKIFGYPADSLIGKNVNTLMPEPYHSNHDFYLKRYQATGEAKVIGIGREVEGQRVDGSRFPVELSVNPVKLASGICYAGVIRDISRRKEIESALDEERRFTRSVVDSLPVHIAVLDEHGCVIFVNDAWRRFLYECGLNDEDDLLGKRYIEIAEQTQGVKSETALEFAARLKALLTGGDKQFSLEYPCFLLNVDRWFQMHAVRFEHMGKTSVVMSDLDITARVKAEQVLTQEKKALEEANNMLSLTQDALERTDIAEMWLSADSGRVLRASERACEQLGYSHEELLTLSVPEFDPYFPVEIFRKQIDELKRRGWDRFETVHQNKQGMRRPVEITAMYRSAESNSEEMIICFVTDITKRKEAEIEIILAQEAAEAANRAKSTFLATMSHEIRTPLNGVVATLDMLEISNMDDYQRDLLCTAQESSVTLMGIIDDILDFSKIEAGRLELQPEPLSLESVIEGVAETMLSNAIHRQVELLIYCDPRLPPVLADPIRVRQVIYNLVGNAIKFSTRVDQRKGQVVVSVELLRESDGLVELYINVRDNGIGMSHEVQNRLFKPFAQGEESTSRRFGGTGLGLVICRRLIDMMGGRIELQSWEGEGTLFSVYLTFKKVNEVATQEQADLEGITVLLVGDEQESLGFMDNYLHLAGADVKISSVSEAQRLFSELSRLHGDVVIIIDSIGGDLDSISLMDQLKSLKDENSEVRFIVVSRGKRRHVRSYSEDGFTLDLNAMRRVTLLNAVAVAAGRESLLVDTISNNSRLPTEVVDKAKRSKQLILLVDDNATNRKVIGQQLTLLGYSSKCANDGKEALEMWRKEYYNLILTDCHMPEMDGYQLSKAIRQEEGEANRTPIIAITADAMKGTAQACFNAGMDDYLTKPIQLTQLQASLVQWLPDMSSDDAEVLELAPSNGFSELHGGGYDQDVIDPLALGNLLGTQDKEMLADYYNDFLESSEPTVDLLHAAVEEHDLSVVGSLAHKLKSSARTVGANGLADCCLALEQAGKEGNAQAVSQHKETFFTLLSQVREWIEGYCSTD